MKRKLILITAIVLVVLLAWVLMPKTSTINVQTTAYEYAMDQKEPLAEHEISISGQYTRRLFRENVFRGQMIISGFPETDGVSVYVQFQKPHSFGLISYQQGGVPVWDTELKQMVANKDFSQFIIQIFEIDQEGDEIHAAWSGDTGRVLATASDYDAMTALCTELGLTAPAEKE